MLHAFTLNRGHLLRIRVEKEDDLRANVPIWVDMVAATLEEVAWVEAVYDLRLPIPDTCATLKPARVFLSMKAICICALTFYLARRVIRTVLQSRSS